MTELTDEEKAKAAADAVAAKAAAKATKDAEKAAAKAAKEAEKAKAKADAEAAKAATKVQMPEQNGVRRPRPDGKCGAAWALFDKVSETKGAPTSLAEVMPQAKAEGQNEANVRAEYARWRKFYGITGRIEDPNKEAEKKAKADAAAKVKADKKAIADAQKAEKAAAKQKLKDDALAAKNAAAAAAAAGGATA